MTLLKSKSLRSAFLLAFSKAKTFLDFSEAACKSKDYRVCDKTQIPVANGARKLLGLTRILKFVFLQCTELTI